MGFKVPDSTPAPQLPAALVTVIDESVKRFEKQLRHGLGMFASTVNVGRWVQNYREEVISLALDVLRYARRPEQ